MEVEQALKLADTWGPIPSCPPNGDAQALMALAAEVRKLREERDAAFAMSRCECETNECCANLMRYRDALEAVADLAGWHSDDEAAPDDTSPDDMVAHVNGLIRQRCKAAIMGPNVQSQRDAQALLRGSAGLPGSASSEDTK